jgi:hypothetical protein
MYTQHNNYGVLDPRVHVPYSGLPRSDFSIRRKLSVENWLSLCRLVVLYDSALQYQVQTTEIEFNHFYSLHQNPNDYQIVKEKVS